MATKQAQKTITKATKAKVVAELSEKVSKATAMVLTNYQGMTHIQLEELKRGLKKADAELAVTKNTLLKRAIESTGYSLQTTAVDGSPSSVDLDGPTATLFTYGDPVLPLKELSKSIKNLKLPVIKLGIFEGRVLSEADVVRLSTLPPKEVFLGQLVGGLKSPLFGLHRALNWNLSKLVLTLNAIQAKK